jgi:hypothetical protein
MRRSRSTAEIGVLLFFNGVAELFLLMSAVLRETPEFWRNEGGYPIPLRELVFYLHYPLLLLVFAATTAATVMSLRFLAENRGAGGGRMLFLCGLQWLLFATALTIMLWNNVQNLLNGHPLHFHVNP